MKLIISPAKNVRYTDLKRSGAIPFFQYEAQTLIKELRKYAPWELETILQIGEDIALRAYNDFQKFKLEGSEGFQALYSYNGLAFDNMLPSDFKRAQREQAAEQVIILSGLYGLLHAEDLIQPHRLEMQGSFRIDQKSLYRFWHDKIYKRLYEEDSVIINLASEEYAKTVRKYLKPWDVFVDVHFLVGRGSGRKMVAAWCKMARGQMIGYAIRNGVTEPEGLKGFVWSGFSYDKELSSEKKLVFSLCGS